MCAKLFRWTVTVTCALTLTAFAGCTGGRMGMPSLAWWKKPSTDSVASRQYPSPPSSSYDPQSTATASTGNNPYSPAYPGGQGPAGSTAQATYPGSNFNPSPSYNTGASYTANNTPGGSSYPSTGHPSAGASPGGTQNGFYSYNQTPAAGCPDCQNGTCAIHGTGSSAPQDRYTGGASTYPTGGSSYPAGGSSYPTGGSSYPKGGSTYPTGGSGGNFGSSPAFTADSRNQLGSGSSYTPSNSGSGSWSPDAGSSNFSGGATPPPASTPYNTAPPSSSSSQAPWDSGAQHNASQSNSSYAAQPGDPPASLSNRGGGYAPGSVGRYGATQAGGSQPYSSSGSDAQPANFQSNGGSNNSGSYNPGTYNPGAYSPSSYTPSSGGSGTR